MSEHALTPERAPAPLVTTSEAARFLAVSERTVLRLKAAGRLPYVQVARNTIRYRAEALAAWAESQEQRENPASESSR